MIATRRRKRSKGKGVVFSCHGIAQFKHGVQPDGTSVDETLIFGHDGHGSVRVLYDLAATSRNLINQIATYAAYGSVIAIHSGIGQVIGTSEAAFGSTQQYSGEQ